MKDKYIKASKLLDKFDPNSVELLDTIGIRLAIVKVPAEDVMPVKHGKLTDLMLGRIPESIVYGKCSMCGGWNHGEAKYCNWCGAKFTTKEILQRNT